MVVGKTSSSISKTEILQHYSEAEVLSAVFPDIKALPCLVTSPLRKDTKPSFSIYVTNSGHIRYKDHATGDNGTLLDLLCQYWSCSFSQALERVGNLFVDKEGIVIKPKQIKTFTRKEQDHLTSLQVAIRPWRDYDYDYWASYGVERKWLHYAEIYPISYKIITKKLSTKDKGKKYIFPADKYAYCFVERKEGKLSLKIYQPFNTKGYKWCSKMDSSVIGLWTKVPQTGDRVVICSSLKDALCVSCQLHIPTLCLQGEGYNMSDTAINELKRRFKKVFIAFDVDKPGISDSTKLAERTGFINIIPDLGTEKDFSDYYKSLKDKSEFKDLINYFQ